jgi:hypothetical protein
MIPDYDQSPASPWLPAHLPGWPPWSTPICWEKKAWVSNGAVAKPGFYAKAQGIHYQSYNLYAVRFQRRKRHHHSTRAISGQYCGEREHCMLARVEMPEVDLGVG